MSNIVKLTPWDIDIDEFKIAEQKVAENFIYGVVELGNILKEKREKYKSKGEWTKYLEEIDKSMAGANQFIRIFEYAEKHKNEFYTLNLTNWERINKFLALPEKLRLQLAKEISGQNISNKDFKENLIKVKGEMPEENLKHKNNPKENLKKGVALLELALIYLKEEDVNKLKKSEKKVFKRETERTVHKILVFLNNIT